MSRLRTGHTPDAWSDLGPSSALIRHQASVSAEPIGNMKPVLTYRMPEAHKQMIREARARTEAQKAAP